MKKAMIFLVVGLISLSSLMASEKPYKAHFMLYTNSAYQEAEDNWPNDPYGKMVSRFLDDEVILKKNIMDTDSAFDGQWVFFGPYNINYDEHDRNETVSDIHGGLTTEGEPLKRAWDSLKTAYNIQTINPFVMTDFANYQQKGGPIMIRDADEVPTDYAAMFLTLVNTREGKHTLTPMYEDFPEKHPSSQDNWRYGTLGTASANWVFPVFAHKDSALIYFETEEGAQDSVYFPLGDDQHNVLDPDYGWDLSVVMDDSGADLEFETVPDTLTLKEGLIRWWELYPGWNDLQTEEVLYVAGDHIHLRRDLYPNKLHVAYKSFGQDASETDLIGYAVDIPHLQDAFALEYILVRFVEHMEIPTLSVPDSIDEGAQFTVLLNGTPELMTSWIPEISISGINAEFIKRDGYTWIYQAHTSGQMTVTLHHRSLRVLEDEIITRTVLASAQKPSAPTGLMASVEDEGIVLSWNNMEDVTFTVYRDGHSIAEDLDMATYTDTDDLGNGTYVYTVTATNDVGESDMSDEEVVTITSVREADLDAGFRIYPNPVTDLIHIDTEHRLTSLTLYDIMGEMRKEYASTTSVIRVQNLPPGVYYLKIESSNSFFVHKIIKH